MKEGSKVYKKPVTGATEPVSLQQGDALNAVVEDGFIKMSMYRIGVIVPIVEGAEETDVVFAMGKVKLHAGIVRALALSVVQYAKAKVN